MNAASDVAYTNQKVIVARSYAGSFQNPDPDPSARDHAGHGTATAMIGAELHGDRTTDRSVVAIEVRRTAG